MSEWIEHKGGCRPVDPDALVHVRFQRTDNDSVQEESVRPMKAKYYWWDHKFYEGSPSGGNIVSYRIVTPSEPHEPSSSQAP
ncbi:hypothetical protein [Rhizobium sp. J15]|uniref:hypothetical protein n=1 Tax=Rhizobium sp. J15 TaxID=2035450 RepID=UPI001144706F|nr:hypothetical protein [Rhizobium sp. J15]